MVPSAAAHRLMRVVAEEIPESVKVRSNVVVALRSGISPAGDKGVPLTLAMSKCPSVSEQAWIVKARLCRASVSLVAQVALGMGIPQHLPAEAQRFG